MTCFWENRLNCEYVTLSRQTSSTRIAKHRSFIKIKFLQNFCSSCKTLVDQVARNSRFYYILHWHIYIFKNKLSSISTSISGTFPASKWLQRKYFVLQPPVDTKTDYSIIHRVWKTWRDKSNGVTSKSLYHIFRPDSNKTAVRRVYILNQHIDTLTTCSLATDSSLSPSNICQLSIHSIITPSLLRFSPHIRIRNCDTSLSLHKVTLALRYYSIRVIGYVFSS
jgi:hypothetical protein